MSATFPILTFHGIGPAPRALESGEARYWITRDAWREFVGRMRLAPTLKITFDDGNSSDCLFAADDLAAAGLSATFFVVADRLDTPHFLSVSDIRRLLGMGMSIGSHGAAHVAWKGLTDGELRREAPEAKDRIEQALGSPITDAACPFGAYDRRSLAALRNAGFQRVLTSDGGWAISGQWVQPRTSLRAEHAIADLERLLNRPSPLSEASRRVKGMVKRWV